MMSELSAEVLEFVRPEEHEKTLYISKIPASFEEELRETLYSIFSKHGLIYSIVVKNSQETNATGQPINQTEAESCRTPVSTRSHFYAFVKFYTIRDARNARRALAGRFFLKGQSSKIKFAQKKTEPITKCILYYSKCFELANHCLGFNKWNINILRNDISSLTDDRVRCVSVVKLEVHSHKLSCYGFAEAQEDVNTRDISTKSVAICKARKVSYQYAIQDAFSKLILVILPNGRVHPEINTTVEERINYDEDLDITTLIKINELDESPDVSDEGDADVDLDMLNQQILEELDDQSDCF